jgi:hypothetical protein
MQQTQTAEELIDIPAIGSPLGGGFFAGEFLLEGECYALIVAPKEAGEELGLQYKEKDLHAADGARSEEDGLVNTDMLNDAKYPAAHFCHSLCIGGYNDWYLPSRDELALLCQNLGPRRKGTPMVFGKGGAEAFETTRYWSSTAHASYSMNAWLVTFNEGPHANYSKGYFGGVRAVRRFKI